MLGLTSLKKQHLLK